MSPSNNKRKVYMLEPQIELPDDAFPRLTTDSKTVLVPQVQSMRDYILLHYKKPLSAALCEWIESSRSDPPVAYSDTCSIINMSFWREVSSALMAHIRISVDMLIRSYGKKRIERREFCAEVLFDMESDISLGACSFMPYDTAVAPDAWMLSDYLVPILRKDEIEQGAEVLLKEFYPEAIDDPKKNDAYKLAQCMGLNVMRLPLHDRVKTRSMLFFCEGTLTLKDDTLEDELPYDIQIPGNTIVINTNAVHKDNCQMDIYHECIHYDWHYMFYRLQDMHNNDIRQLQTVRIINDRRKHRANPLIWMEWQAQRGGFGLMMPQSMIRPLIREELEDMNGYSMHMGKKMDYLARGIAREYDLPKFRVRARIIQMGYIAAKGALNYVDDHYIAPFAFSTENCSGDYTFVINRKSAYEEYERNSDFRKRIESGRYVYADGHICLNDPRFIMSGNRGATLTTWANAHVDKCCLRFISVYEQDETTQYRFGALNSDEEYNNHYLTFTDEEHDLTRQEQLTAMASFIDNLPDTFHETLELLMRKQKITIERLEQRAQISSRTISRLRTEERRDYSLDQVIAICVALHLPPWLSNELLTLAGFTLRKIPRHRVYRFVLDCMFMDSLEDVQRFLVANGQQPLKLKASA